MPVMPSAALVSAVGVEALEVGRGRGRGRGGCGHGLSPFRLSRCRSGSGSRRLRRPLVVGTVATSGLGSCAGLDIDDRGAAGERGALDDDGRQRVLAPDLLHPEPAGVGDLRGGLERLGEVAPEPRHLVGALERPLRVREEAAAGAVDGGAVAHAGEDVLEHLPPPVVGVHVVRDRHRESPADGRWRARRAHAPPRRRRGGGPPRARAGRRRVSFSRAAASPSAPGNSAKSPRGRAATSSSGTATSSRAPPRCRARRILRPVRARHEPAQPRVPLAILREQHEPRGADRA